MLREAAKILRDAGHAVVLTGAGISAESGIPTFRGKDGLWNRYRPEELATPEAFARNPKLVWEWYAWRMGIIFSAKPSGAHRAIARMEEDGIVKAVITQNVDDLHERAGSRNVLHLHGEIAKIICSDRQCDYAIRVREPPEINPLPECPECGSLLRPGVVWFGEALPADVLREAMELCEKSDVILVVGTSAVVQPAASLPLIVKRNGGTIIEINPDETPLTPFSLSIRCPASALEDVLKLLVD
jgi:NAD-dependent deacetylase